MARPNPYCQTCRGTGRKQTLDHQRLTMDLVVEECDCVKDQRIFEYIALDIFLIVAILAIAKFIFS
jgi:hypothetical protein